MNDEISQPDFQALMRAALAGDEEASRVLYETYGKHVLVCVRHRMWRRLRSQFDSQDFTQQVWKSFFDDRSELPDFQTPDDLIAYLQTIAQRKVVLEGRRRRQLKNDLRRETPVYEDSDTAGPHPATRLPTPSAVAIVREAYDRWVEPVEPDAQEVVDLRLKGNSFEEIGEQLEMNKTTARRKLQPVRRRASEDRKDGK